MRFEMVGWTGAGGDVKLPALRGARGVTQLKLGVRLYDVRVSTARRFDALAGKVVPKKSVVTRIECRDRQ